LPLSPENGDRGRPRLQPIARAALLAHLQRGAVSFLLVRIPGRPDCKPGLNAGVLYPAGQAPAHGPVADGVLKVQDVARACPARVEQCPPESVGRMRRMVGRMRRRSQCTRLWPGILRRPPLCQEVVGAARLLSGWHAPANPFIPFT
jgi:hypothetical protein